MGQVFLSASTSISYYIVPSLGWDNATFYDKTDNGKFFTLSGTSANITFDNIGLSGGKGTTLYTRLKIYDGNGANKTLLWVGPKTAEASQLTPHFTGISALDYNSGSGPIAGDGNTLRFTINRSGSASASYYIVPYVGWSENGLWEKRDNKTFVTLNGNQTEVTIPNIALSDGDSMLYTKIRIYADANLTTLLWEGPSSALTNNISSLKTINLDDDYTAYQEVHFDSTVTYLQFNKPIPANKILVVSYHTKPVLARDKAKLPLHETDSFLDENNPNDLAVTYIKPMIVYDKNYKSYWPQGGWSPPTRISYYKIEDGGDYKVKVEFNNSALVRHAWISVYMADYVSDDISDGKAFKKLDAQEYASSEDKDNYLIFNAPELLGWGGQQNNHIADIPTSKYNYISRMPVNGNANIYWEHWNNYGKSMTYGILLHNTSSETIKVTINKKSAYSAADVGWTNTPLRIWHDYYNEIIQPDLSNIPNKELTLIPGSSGWIYAGNISAGSTDGELFNGILNISVRTTNEALYEGDELQCYAFMMNKNQHNVVKTHFDSNNSLYQRPYGYDKGLSGSSYGPVLSSNLGTINLSDGSTYTNHKYKLILTGLDAPFLNDGERMPLRYNGQDILDNAVNYSVIYKLHFDGFGKNDVKATFEYNPYTNTGPLIDKWGVLYVVVKVNGVVISRLLGRNVPYVIDNIFDYDKFKLNPGDPVDIEIICSGMSGLPVTVTFE